MRTVVLENALFGELALIADGARTATVITLAQCDCIAISKHTFKKHIETIFMAHLRHVALFLNSIPEIALSPSRLTLLSSKCLMLTQRKGVQLTPDNYTKPTDCVYFIKSGSVNLLMEIDGQEFFVRHMAHGDSFGEFVVNDKYRERNLDYRVVTDRISVVLSVRKEDFFTYVHPNKMKSYFTD